MSIHQDYMANLPNQYYLFIFSKMMKYYFAKVRPTFKFDLKEIIERN